jgi:hypothetical protein
MRNENPVDAEVALGVNETDLFEDALPPPKRLNGGDCVPFCCVVGAAFVLGVCFFAFFFGTGPPPTPAILNVVALFVLTGGFLFT